MNINWLRRLTGREGIHKMAFAHAGTGTDGRYEVPSREQLDAANLPSAADLLDADLYGEGGTQRQHRPSLQARQGQPQMPTQTDELMASLKSGMPVKLGNLKAVEAGWMYQGIPVMVFAVATDRGGNPTARQTFFYRVHLSACCAELEDPEQLVMIGTDYSTLQALAEKGQFAVCHDCLQTCNYLDYSHRAHSERDEFVTQFSFPHYVASRGSEYFRDRTIRQWSDSTPLQPLGVVAPGEPVNCASCGWTIYADDHYLLSDCQASALKLPHHTCVLCANEALDGTVVLPRGSAESIYHKRFIQLQPEVNNWRAVRRHLDRSWHSLTYCLQRHNVQVPELYAKVADDLIAPITWPTFKRAIVADTSQGIASKEWDVWTRAEVLKRFLE